MSTTTERSTPAGTKQGDGYQTLIACEGDPDIEFFEKTVRPIGMDGGDPVDTTTMHNTVMRTMAPRTLKTATPAATRVAYDPMVLDSIIAQINVNQWWTIHHPNGDTWDFCGFLKSFTPADNAEGTQPEADVEIVPTNTDPTTAAESTPNQTTALGTD